MARELRLGSEDLKHAVYQGLIDDKVAEYPWGTEVDPPYLDAVLRRSAVFERTMLVNDGYLLHEDPTSMPILDPNSLLRRLMGVGHVVVLGRTENIEDVPPTTERTVPKYRAMVGSPAWLDIKNRLARVRKSDAYFWVRWPKADNRPGFGRLIGLMAGRTPAEIGLGSVAPEQLEAVLRRFEQLRNFDPRVGARSHWEQAATEIAAGSRPALHQLMYLGNEAYHYNLAATLAASGHASISVSTKVSPAFAPHFIPRANRIPNCAFTLPDGLSRLPSDKFVQVVLDPEVRRTKTRFLDTLDAWGPSGDDEVRSAAHEYGTALRVAYQRVAVGRRTKAGLLVGAFGVGLASAVGAPLLGLVSVPAAIVGGVGVAVGALPAPHLLAMWRGSRMLRDLTKSLAPPQLAVVNAYRASQVTATAALDLQRAARHTAGLPTFDG